MITKDTFKAQASLCICNCLALEIMLDETGGYVYYKYSDSDEVGESLIEYENNCTGIEDCDTEALPYFYTDEGVQYCISDFIRTNL